MAIEIERKYLVTKFPKQYPIISDRIVEQSYVEVTDDHEVRIRKDTYADMSSKYYLTRKNSGSLIREEFEDLISKEEYYTLLSRIDAAPIIKHYKVLKLDDGTLIEYSHVDPTIKRGWRYVEVEFNSVEEANEFDIKKYISNAIEVTDDSRYKMKNYWLTTRMSGTDCRESILQFIRNMAQYMYDIKNRVGEYPNSGFVEDKNIYVIPGGFRNIRLAIMGDEFKVHPPHFHFFKRTSPISAVTGKHGGALLIKDTIHFKHDSHQDRINYVEIKALKKFLSASYPGMDISVWKFILIKWNEMNPQSIQRVDPDLPIPEYFHNMIVQFGKQPRNPNKGRKKNYGSMS